MCTANVQVLDIAMNPNSWFADHQNKLRASNASVSGITALRISQLLTLHLARGENAVVALKSCLLNQWRVPSTFRRGCSASTTT